jgi:hypothetical protein
VAVLTRDTVAETQPTKLNDFIEQHSTDTTSDQEPVADHPATADVDIDGMELSTDAEGWRAFPHPAEITAHVDEDMDADRATFPDDVQEAIDKLTDEPELGEFLVSDATAAYEYLEKLQKTNDLHLENFYRQQLLINSVSGGRGYSKGKSLSTYDKRWIVQWEIRRRIAERDLEWTEYKLTKENSGLPNNDSEEQ